MDNNDCVLYECTEGVALLTMNRPNVMNAFSEEMREALLVHLQEAGADPKVRCIVITGYGKAFSAGGDIANMVGLQEANDTEVIPARIDIAGRVLNLLKTLPKPVIAAINGAAAGGGMNLSLGCDMRLGSPKTFFSEAFVRIGLVPDWGGFHSLTRIVGTSKAMQLMMTGERVPADEAFRLGLLDQLFDVETFLDDSMAFASRIASGPSQALARIKEGVYLGANGTLEDVVAFERQVQTELFLTDDSREGMKAFMEKRPPRFK
ncbi:MAG: enoyl-CoA hydratase/isomerase family protein [Chromatiales bacterium]|jgi:2-(1,2-epoxy-1,2-dihydrophenyl)acetyl-CoA isomerase|nr:enoyl-CoA hydratase/isomerase family protein [Chromatiales bacterium]